MSAPKKLPMTVSELHEKYLAKYGKEFPFEIVGSFDGCAKHSVFYHRHCDYQWRTTAHKILNAGRGCPRCSGTERFKSSKEWVASYERKTGKTFECTFLEPYTTAKTSTLVKHDECGFEWKVRPCNLLSGKGCPRCSSNEQYPSSKEWLAAYERKHSKECEYEMIGKYTHNKKNTEFHHKACGHTWSARPANIMNGRGCPRCALYGFRHERDSALYYLKASDKTTGESIYKIGITNFNVKERFRKCSEVEFHEWRMDGRSAMEAEKNILAQYKDHRIDNNYFGYGNGSTEWFSKDVMGLFE